MPPEPDEIQRISREYGRRARELPRDAYSWQRPDALFQYTQRLRILLPWLEHDGILPLGPRRILEVGCGHGAWLLDFVRLGAGPGMVHGIDLDSRRLERARELLPQADLRLGNADRLPWPDGHFDLVSQAVMFTSILSPALKRAVAQEMLRVLAPGGHILWYDFAVDNPWNAQVRGIRPAELQALFPGRPLRWRRLTLAPPLARWVVPRSWLLGCLLERLPLLRTHLLATVQ